jgi:serine/threonine-protein kinase ULK/ATG1
MIVLSSSIFKICLTEITLQPRRPLHDRKHPSGYEYVNDNLQPPPDSPVTTNHITFPPTQISVPIPPPLSSSPSNAASRAAANALNRALSIASKKLFGNATHSRRSSSKDFKTSAPSSPRRPIISLDANPQRDPMEDKLLAILEELAQKTEVLTHWADEMYEYVKAIPQSMSPMDQTKTIINLR